MCPGSAAAYPTLSDLVQYYGEKIKFIFYPFPLPYHHNSFYAAKAGVVVDLLTSKTGSSRIWEWIDLIFKNQQTWFNDPTINMTGTQVIKGMAHLASQLNINDDLFITYFNNPDLDQNARIIWKYGAARGVYGTPLFYVNGVLTSADSTWTIEQWRKILDPLLLSYRNVDE